MINMETTLTPTRISKADAADDFDARFRPRGAIAFFVLLVILGLIIWFGIYFLMLKRAA